MQSNFQVFGWIGTLLCCVLFVPGNMHGQEHTVARNWNELILDAIRNDFARPTIHARNLFHTSVAMYDAWALLDSQADTYLIGRQHPNFISDFDQTSLDLLRANQDLDETISYAVYRIVLHRYQNAPGFDNILSAIDSYMIEQGYDPDYIDFEYRDGDPASLGNFIALEIIQYGLTDGANEEEGYRNRFYETVNAPLDPVSNTNIEDIDPNRWQPLFFNNFVDQAGNPLPEAVPGFLSPEWGEVIPFSLTDTDRRIYERDGQTYQVYLDPGAPPLFGSDRQEEYQWGFALVSRWSAHLDPSDPKQIDISPRSIGNIDELPTSIEEYKDFYDDEGGDGARGYALNPHTDEPYEEQWVSRGDYARVLAEFWADGPDSETPPGHWFEILNYVIDAPEFDRRYKGTVALDPLEYDVKAYFMLGGAMHDAAVAAWSVKGYYDYIRPISALRHMAHLGQSSDPSLPRYDAGGIPLIDGYIELILPGDNEFDNEHDLYKIKLKSWKGPDYIGDPESDVAGVGWILAEDWWPYQRPSFVTPPFAGYVSGHSTFSRAAAEILTYFTGDPFFPGGMGTFLAERDEHLVFEDGPSDDIILQWATYRDASDQCSLSRIWGGIHPPADDIPGRMMGIELSQKVIRLANHYYNGTVENVSKIDNNTILYPNPIGEGSDTRIEIDGQFSKLFLMNNLEQVIYTEEIDETVMELPTSGLPIGVYFVVLTNANFSFTKKLIIQ